MTQNQINNRRNDIEERDAKERQRHNKRDEQIKERDVKERERTNRVNEQIGIANAITKPLGDVVKTAGRVAAAANSPEYYCEDEEAAKAAASLSFSDYAGQVGTLPSLDASGGVTLRPMEGRPGIFISHWIPAFGKLTGTAQDAINQAAQIIMGQMRSRNAGQSFDYEKSDVMQLILALDSVLIRTRELRRAFRIILNWHARNKYLGTLLSRALHWGAATVPSEEDLTMYKRRWAELVQRIASLNFPTKMPLFKRHAFLADNVFIENDAIKSFLYAHVCTGYYYYDTAQGVNVLNVPDTVSDATKFKTFKAEFDAINDMLNAILEDQYAAKMMGDIERAYGSESVIDVSDLVLDEAPLPIYVSKDAAEQIHNTVYVGKMCGHGFETNGWDIIQTSSSLLKYRGLQAVSGLSDSANPITVASSWAPPFSQWWVYKQFALDTEKPMPTYKDVMEMSRGVVSFHHTLLSDGDGHVIATVVDDFGSEVFTHYDVWNTYSNPSYPDTDAECTSGCSFHVSTTGGSVNLSQAQNKLRTRLMSFHSAPAITFLYMPGTSTSGGAYWYFWGTDNVSTWDTSTLEGMHRVAILSEVALLKYTRLLRGGTK